MDVERPSESDERIYNLTAFKDPRMKAFIRVMNQVEAQGPLPAADVVAELGDGADDEDEEEE